MDLAIPAAESEAAAAAAAGAEQQRREVARCGEAERPLRLAFRLLLLHLRHAPEARAMVSALVVSRRSTYQQMFTPNGSVFAFCLQNFVACPVAVELLMCNFHSRTEDAVEPCTMASL